MRTHLTACVLWIALTLPAQAGNPWTDTRRAREQVTVDFLYETCHVVGETAHGMIPHFDCESYVYGVLDAHLAVSEKLPKSEQACFPSGLAPWKALEEAQSGVTEKVWKQDAASFLIESLRKTYPCR